MKILFCILKLAVGASGPFIAVSTIRTPTQTGSPQDTFYSSISLLFALDPFSTHVFVTSVFKLGYARQTKEHISLLFSPAYWSGLKQNLNIGQKNLLYRDGQK